MAASAGKMDGYIYRNEGMDDNGSLYHSISVTMPRAAGSWQINAVQYSIPT